MSTNQTSDTIANIVREFGVLPPNDQASVVHTLTAKPIPEVSQETANRIWLIIVSAFSAVLVASLGLLAGAIFSGNAQAQMLLTVFTAAAGFLAGLLAPSPLQDKQPSNT